MVVPLRESCLNCDSPDLGIAMICGDGPHPLLPGEGTGRKNCDFADRTGQILTFGVVGDGGCGFPLYCSPWPTDAGMTGRGQRSFVVRGRLRRAEGRGCCRGVKGKIAILRTKPDKSGHLGLAHQQAADAVEGRGWHLRVALSGFPGIEHRVPQWLSWTGPAFLFGVLRAGQILWYIRSISMARGCCQWSVLGSTDD